MNLSKIGKSHNQAACFRVPEESLFPNILSFNLALVYESVEKGTQ